MTLFLLWLAFSCFCAAAVVWLCARGPLWVSAEDLEQIARDREEGR